MLLHAVISYVITIPILFPVEDALNQTQPSSSQGTRVPSVKAAAPSSPSTPKRTRDPVVSDYDTRHKRARVSDPGPGASRKKVRVSRKKVEPKLPIPGNQGESKSPWKRNTALLPKRREVFDGVLLNRTSFGKGKGKEGGSPAGEDEETRDNENDEVLSGLEGNGLNFRDESSLADSNKGETIVTVAFREANWKVRKRWR